MLDPQSRRLLLDALRPPDGYSLDFAIGTTFTLDLLAFLTVPLGFTGFAPDRETDGQGPPADPLVLLRTLRLYAGRVAVFCQAGRIAAPRAGQLLFASLEDSVIPVKAPTKSGVFHPKLWVLRFEPETAGEETPVCYRVICLSRNLTFDRAWDSVVVLDGDLIDRKVAYSVNHPLADFVAELPKLALERDIPKRIRANVRTASDELRRVQFLPPAPFEEYHFWPLGIDGYQKWPFRGRVDRLLVVSPFLSAVTLKKLGEAGEGHVLVSRMDELQYLSRSQLSDFSQVYALDPSAGSELQSEETTSTDRTSHASGLHAKIYVTDEGWNASVWTGSANATEAAFERNVEFLVQLTGKRSACGVAAVLSADKGNTSLRDMLLPFEPLPTPAASDHAAEELEALIDIVRHDLSAMRWSAQVTASGGAHFRMELSPEKGLWPKARAGTAVSCWPITLPASYAQRVESGRDTLPFGPLTLEALTTFFAFDVEARNGSIAQSARFVVPARLIGAPADRHDRLLQYHLRDPERLVRFLLLLITTDVGEEGDLSAVGWGGVESSGTGTREVEALLEPLLKALHDNPRGVDEVARVVDALRSGDDATGVLPPGFDRIWNAISEARGRMMAAAKGGRT